MAPRALSIASALLLLALLAAALLTGRGGSSVARAAAPVSAAPTADDSFESVLGLPATNVVVLGASSASGKVWATGTLGQVPATVDGAAYANQEVLLEHSALGGWQVVPLPPAAIEHGKGVIAGSGRTTTEGGVALVTQGGLVASDPGGQPKLVATPEASLLGEGEYLPSQQGPAEGEPTVFEALEDGGGHTGLLVVPYREPPGKKHIAFSPRVLHYDGETGAWTDEQVVGSSTEAPGFAPQALSCGGNSASNDPDARSPANCWLLASYRTEASPASPQRVALFRRVPTKGTNYEWREQTVKDEDPLIGEFGVGASEPTSVDVPPGPQTLTVTSQGVWIDMQAKLGTNQQVSVSKFLVAGSEEHVMKVEGTWCFPTGTFCSTAASLGAQLPARYTSTAWPGSTTKPGVRIISSLYHRSMLEFNGERFSVVVGAGGEGDGLAAFSEPGEGWIADGTVSSEARDEQGQSQVIHITTHPSADELAEEAVPFRRPLYAVTPAPGSTPGDPNAEALAVGAEGEIARYVPGHGWRSESLYNAEGKVQPTLRAVAWPVPGRAYAVGDDGTMWYWLASTGLWKPDPGEPLSFDGNLTAMAFSTSNPDLGYAVGRQGVLLRFGKSWEQEPPCPAAGSAGSSKPCMSSELSQVNFTSIAFAGKEAIATFRRVEKSPEVDGGEQIEVGGVAVQEGSEPWHIDPGAQTLLGQLPPVDTVLSRVAGLADGGAVAAGPGLVIERESQTSPWRFSPQPLPEAENVSALGAYRDASGTVRAVVSMDLDPYLNPEKYAGNLETSQFKIDVLLPTGANEPPTFLPPDLTPNSGYVVKETSHGWEDIEHQALPAIGDIPEMPERPDPVLSLLVSPSGTAGLAVGGQTGDYEGNGPSPELNRLDVHHQTAAAMRFPASSASSDGATPSTIATTPGRASFVIAGSASCSTGCEAFSNEGVGPEVWLEHSLATANEIAKGSPGGLRAYLYTGSSGGEDVFARVLARTSITVPAYGPESGATAPGVEAGPVGTAAYAFQSTGPGGLVEVIVLDFSTGTIEGPQQVWLEERLKNARGTGTPAIVMGSASLGVGLPGGPGAPGASDAATVASILVQDGASAYFFDYPENNVKTQLVANGESIPAYGTGTLGYVSPPNEDVSADSLGSSGMLLAEVDVAEREPKSNRAPVSVRLAPNISQLAIDATDGVLLRRSHVALFEALARRPNGGAAITSSANGTEAAGPDPYDPIPFNCQGANCADEIPTDFTLSSSNPEVGGFVVHDPSSHEPSQILLGANQLPVPDEPRNANGELNSGGEYSRENPTGPPGKRYPINERGEIVPYHQSSPEEEPVPLSESGTFCAYNSGTTIVSITTGGLTYSEPVTVQAGSVEDPCGTVPLKNPPLLSAPAHVSFEVPSLSPSHPKLGPTVPAIHIPVPQAPAPVVHHEVVISKPKPTPSYPFVNPPAQLVPILAVVPPPLPTAIRPTPPSGTAQVPAQSPITQAVPQKEEEEEQAIQHVHHYAAYDRPEPLRQSTLLTAYSHPEQGPLAAWPLGLVLIAALAGIALLPMARSRERVYLRGPRD